MFKIGLTGGIASGKTTIEQLFQKLGVPVLDADLIARDLVEPNKPAFASIIGHFGSSFIKDGCLDRAMLRKLIFNDPLERKWLESILHPLIYSELQERSNNLESDYCIMVIPLLLENGRSDFVNRILLVDCPEYMQHQRLASRDGLNDEEISKILAAQMKRQDRLKAADDILENINDIEQLFCQVKELHKTYSSMAKSDSPKIKYL